MDLGLPERLTGDGSDPGWNLRCGTGPWGPACKGTDLLSIQDARAALAGTSSCGDLQGFTSLGKDPY